MNEDKQGWRSQPVMWLFAGLLLTVVLASIATFWLALRSNDGLVVDDYYKRGNEIAVVLERDQAARRRGVQAELLLGTSGQELRLMLQHPNPPPSLRLRLAHPTRAGLDQDLQLQWQGGPFYAVRLPEPLPAQRWLVELSAEDWRLRGEAELLAGGRLPLQAPTQP